MSLNRYAIALKRGDQQTAIGKENLAMRHNMIVDEWDEQERGISLDAAISDYSKQVYTWVIIDRAQKHFVRSVIQKPQLKTDSYARSHFLNVESLGVLGAPVMVDSRGEVGKGGVPLMDKTQTADVINFVDATAYGAEIFQPSALLANVAPIEDLMLVTAGSYTVGTGMNYATWTLAFADIGTMNGNLTFTQTTNVTETANHILTSAINGYTLTCNGGWYTLYIAGDISGLDFRNYGPGTVTVFGFNFRRTSDSTAYYAFVQMTEVLNAQVTLTCYDCTMRGFSSTDSSGGFSISSENQILAKIWNCKLYRLKRGIINLQVNSGSAIENCDIYDTTAIGISIYQTPTGITFQNNRLYASAGACFSGAISGLTGKNNTMNDASGADANWGTGSGNTTGATMSAEYQSVTVGNANFLKTLTTAATANNGIAPTITANTAGSNAGARPHRSAVGITDKYGRGAFEVIPWYVTYNGNGNTGGTAPAVQTGQVGDTALSVSAVGDLAKTGNNFAKWNSAANGSGTDYASGASYTIPASDVTLYAQWAAAAGTPGAFKGGSKKPFKSGAFK